MKRVVIYSRNILKAARQLVSPQVGCGKRMREQERIIFRWGLSQEQKRIIFLLRLIALSNTVLEAYFKGREATCQPTWVVE